MKRMANNRIVRRTRSGLSGLLFFLAQCVFFVLWLFYVRVWMGWTSWGLLIGILSTPGVVIFPALYWIVEGDFPVGYFIVWGVGIALGITSAVVAPNEA